MLKAIIAETLVEPVSLVEAKLQIGLYHDADDALVAVMISAAREEAEGKTRRSLVSKTYNLLIDNFGKGPIDLPQGPVTKINEITYNDGEVKTLPESDYNLREDLLCSVVPVSQWPATAPVPNAVTISYQAGFDFCPTLVKQWIMIRVASLYANRENFTVGTQSMSEMPRSHADCLLDSITIFEAP